MRIKTFIAIIAMVGLFIVISFNISNAKTMASTLEHTAINNISNDFYKPDVISLDIAAMSQGEGIRICETDNTEEFVGSNSNVSMRISAIAVMCLMIIATLIIGIAIYLKITHLIRKKTE